MFRDQEVLIASYFKAWIVFASTFLFWALKYMFSLIVGTTKSILSLLIIFSTTSVSGFYSLHNQYVLKIHCSLGIYCYLSSGSLDYEEGQLLIFPGLCLWLFVCFCWVGFFCLLAFLPPGFGIQQTWLKWSVQGCGTIDHFAVIVSVMFCKMCDINED